ncbi:hypothetical protein ACFFRR_001316 [Megaselia abdita]
MTIIHREKIIVIFTIFWAEALRKNLDELEYVISEINAEQKYLLLRLRRVMEEYFKLLKKIGITINHQIASEHVSNQIKSGFTTSTKSFLPCSVKRRPSYEELLRRFDIYVEQKQHQPIPVKKPEPTQPISLLKPKDERLPSSNILNAKPIDDTPSSQVNRSRFNLRQALSKVVIQSSNSENTSPESSVTIKKKNSGNSFAEFSTKKKVNSDSNSSSEESYEGSREQTPDEVDIIADTQEHFLRLLKLCTKDQASNMSQRRSKRKRRCVQNNDKPDFLYGHIDFDHSRDENKKRKTLLMSPPAVVKNLRKKNELSNKCNECSEVGFDSSLRNCTDCLGYFHDSCHSDNTISKKTRTASCPSCVRIYANAVKDKGHKIETYSRNHKSDTEIENEGDDENSESIEELDYRIQENEIITS